VVSAIRRGQKRGNAAKALAVLSLFMIVTGGAASGEEPLRVGGPIRLPTKINHVNPVYPEGERRLERQQLVFLDVVIDKQGHVKEVRRLHGSKDFAKAAETAVREWRYTPFTLNSKPMSVVFAVSVAFVMAGQPQAGVVADALDDPNELVQLMAVEYIRSAPQSSIPDLAEVLAVLHSVIGEAGRAVQLAAGVAFAELIAREAPISPPEASVEALLQQLSSPDSVIRAAAAWQLAGATDSLHRVRAALLGLSTDEDRRVRYAVQWALGQLPPDQKTSLLAPNTAPPTPKRMNPPEYPEDAFRKKAKGTVVVDILIGEEGEVAHAKVRLSVPSLDDAALACARQWLFDPAKEAGKPVAFFAHVPVRFNIR
jgi:TonB family protein